MADTTERVSVLVYSNLEHVRAQVRSAIGRRPAPDVARIDWVECATHAELVSEMDRGDIDLAILDGESQPTGGMGMSRQLKNELIDCPPLIVLIARKQDTWLAMWSLADGVINTPIDPVTAAEVVAAHLRARDITIPVVR